MAEPENTNTTAPPPQPAKVHSHVIRTLVASFFGSIALFLIMSSILVVWLNQTLTNNSVYVNTVAPLASQPAIQNFVTQKVTSQLITAGSPQNLASTLLPPSQIVGQTPSQQSAEVRAVVSQSVSQVVSSPAFAGLWKSTNQSAQQQLIAELDSNSPNITLDLHPAILGVFSLLNSTKLAAINSHVQIPSSAGNLNLSGSAIPKIHQAYNYFKDGTWVLVAVTLACIGICIGASVHHLKTLRRILVGTGILTLGLAVILKLPGLILGAHNRQGLEQQAILAFINVLLAKLFITCIIIGVICIVAAIVSKIYSKFLSKNRASSHQATNQVSPASVDAVSAK